MVSDDPDDAQRLAELARLLSADVAALTEDELVKAARLSDELRRTTPERTGRLVAELHRRGKVWTWPVIARETSIPQTTVYEAARAFLSDPGQTDDER